MNTLLCIGRSMRRAMFMVGGLTAILRKNIILPGKVAMGLGTISALEGIVYTSLQSAFNHFTDVFVTCYSANLR